MLKIHTTGVEDYLDGSANIKALIIGGPGAGKTRTSSYWPKPIFLDCENGRGSLADRKMPYVEIRTSKDVLDALEYLKSLESTPKTSRQYQTVVFDTADAFQRLVKDEWVQQTKAGSFTGYDAWGYLDTKMQMLFTRLLNLDYNVLVLVHYKDKTFKDGENTVREFMLQLQGAVSDTIFNDFGLVGFLGTYWEADGEGRVQRRGLTFEPTPQKPFLKDRFNVTPKWMPITFTDNDYFQIFEAFFNRQGFEELAESTVVGEIPDSEKIKKPGVTTPTEGGPLPVSQPAEIPLSKMLKGELDAKARGLGLILRGNMLKSEVVKAIEDHLAKAAEAPSTPVAADAVNEVKEIGSPSSDDAAGGASPAASPSNGDTEQQVSVAGTPVDVPFDGRTETEKMLGIEPPPPKRSSPAPRPEPAADATNASVAPSPKSEPAQASEPDADESMDFKGVLEGLGGTVISQEKHDSSPAPQATATATLTAERPAAKGPSGCAECGADLAAEWADPSKKGYIRLSFVKFRKYMCTSCFAAATK